MTFLSKPRRVRTTQYKCSAPARLLRRFWHDILSSPLLSSPGDGGTVLPQGSLRRTPQGVLSAHPSPARTAPNLERPMSVLGVEETLPREVGGVPGEPGEGVGNQPGESGSHS